MHDFRYILLNFRHRAWDTFRATHAYAVANGFNLDLVEAHAGTMAVLPCADLGDGYFELADEGQPWCVIEALDVDAETVIDMVGWPVAAPEKFGTVVGAAAVLGGFGLVNPATWALGGIPAVHRLPVDWLKSGCEGVAVLDHQRSGQVMHQALGPLLSEDATHGRFLEEIIRPKGGPQILVRRRAPIARAA